MEDLDEREEELVTLSAIYPELSIEADGFKATLELAVTPAKPLLVRFVPLLDPDRSQATYSEATQNGAAHVEHDVELTHLPPIILNLSLPSQYPATAAPDVHLSAQHAWLPKEKLAELAHEAENLWEEYGHCQILFSYIDHLQQAADRGFDLDQSPQGCLVLPIAAEEVLRSFDSTTKQAIFDAGTYDCGICLEPKKGTKCYQLKKCAHVFCRSCLQEFYDNAITEGDVSSVRCLAPDCGLSQGTPAAKRKRKRARTLHPAELLNIGVDDSMVRRYVEMKRKKRIEADKSTVYCPRTWCQGAARSTKYPPIPTDLSLYPASESSEDEGDAEIGAAKSGKASTIPANPVDRLVICEKCTFAFCKVCFMSWHGLFARCFPRDPTELSAEEKASYDYIRLNTSPCPYCSSPTSKTMGCNHMICFTCNTHFCYLCGSWLDGRNPYAHFNKPGTECYQRLWELEEGDEGQAPGDGRGFVGGARGWEQMAIEAAREADAQEVAAAAEAAENAAVARAANVPPAPEPPDRGQDIPVEVLMAHVQLNGNAEQAEAPRNRAPRRPRNPFVGHQQDVAAGPAAAVRNHERNRLNPRPAVRPVRQEPDRADQQQQELQRFLRLAQQDQEDGWDSDELADDDEGFVIR